MRNDERLEELLRSVNEVEGMERAPAWGFTRLSIWSAAAALVGGLFVWTVYQWSMPPRAVPLAQGPSAAPTNVEQRGSVVMALAEDGEGKLKCVKWSANTFEGKALDDVASNDLARAGLALACDPGTVRMLVVGMQGPAARMPDSDKRATEIAECILRTPSCGVGAFDSHSCAQAGCAGGDVKVRVEAVALK